MAEEIDISKSLEQSIRDSRRLQGDTNSELNKSINLLSQINDLRDQSIAKVKALNKESINTKDIQREFQKAKEKQELTTIKISKLESSLSNIEKQNATEYLQYIKSRGDLEEKIQRARLRGDDQLVISLGQQLDIVDSEINLKEAGLNIDERRYAATIQANAIALETTKLLKGDLDIEKEIQKSVGLTGVAMGKFSEKLGLGTKYYEELVEKARELEEDGKKLTFIDKLKTLGKVGRGAIKETFSDPLTAIPAVAGIAVGAYKLVQAGLDNIGNAATKAGNLLAGLSQDSSNLVRGLTSGLSDIARKIPLVGGLLGGLIDGFSAILDLVLGVDNFIVKSGRDLNLNTQQARALNREFQNISFNSGNIFTTSRKLLESQVELSNQLGVVNRLTTEQLETNIMLKDIAGLELETRQQIVEVSTITGQTSQNVVKSVLAQVQGLKNATGIQLQNKQVLKEAASLGGYLGLQFAKYPAQLTKSLVTVKAMGMELKQLDSIADSFLDFESSISKEFEAQLLTGKEINLAKAREAFLNNDLATAASEITRQVGSTEEFLKLNRIQAESLASAFGMSRDQMGEMLKRQELLSKLGAKDTDNAQKQLQLGLQRYQNQKALTAAIGEEAYQNLVNASTQEKMASFIEKIKQSIVDFVEKTGLIDKIEGFVNKLSDPNYVNGLLKKVQGFFASAVEFVGEASYQIVNALDYLAFGQIDESFIKGLRSGSKNIANQIRSVGSDFTAVSVGEKVANSQVRNSQGAAGSTQDNMSMARPTKDNFNISLHQKMYVVDSKKDTETRIQVAPDFDTKTGK